jgi:hypothetical protein
MSIDTESDSFIYGSSIYDGRPTFALTRRLGDDAGLSLYEFLPEDTADARQRRLHNANSNRKLARVSITDAVPEVNEESDARLDFSQIGSPPAHPPNDWRWQDWCSLKIATLSNRRQQAIHRLVLDVMKRSGVDADFVTRGEGSAVLSEAAGVRMTITFLAMRHIQKYDKLIAVTDSIKQMSPQECYYWHAKCRSPSSPNGVKALRVLLADNQ